jgi:hypothetical protein
MLVAGWVVLEIIRGRHQEESIHRRTQQGQRVDITGDQEAKGWVLEA